MNSSCLPAVAALLAVSSLARAQDAPSSNLEAGGLRPPDAVDATEPPPPENAPEQQLERADEEDSGRGLEWVWLNAEAGVQHLGLQTFKADELLDAALVGTTQTGPVFGAGAGIRLLAFTIGARFRLGSFSDFRLWTLDAEGGFRIPLGRLEPYFSLAAGYASLGSISTQAPASSKADVTGFDARASAGLDYYVSNTFSIGANLSGDLLVLSRPSVDGASASTEGNEAAVYAKDGSGIGAGATLTAVVGLHF